MGKHLLAKAHITKLKKLTVLDMTELPSSTVDETASITLGRHGSQGVLIVRSQRKFKFTVHVLSILIELTDTMF